jgi:2-methylcitrate dehydratase PrpD
MDDPVFAFARNISQTHYDALPEKTVNSTKRLILDSFGVALAGANTEECAILIDMCQHWNGRPESTILRYGMKVTSPMAALINGTMMQAMDFDDTHDLSGAHTASCVLPAALAVGEIKNATGRLLIAAVALGVDLVCRLGLACRQKIGWTSTSVYGCFGAAAAAAKILGLSEEEIRHALGIVISQAAGTTQTALDAPLSKHMQSGFASQAGVLSALLAHKGTTGVQNVFEGKFGFFNLYKAGEYNRDKLFKDLGKRFEVDNLSLKPFPCCRATHGPIEGVLLLIKTHGIRTQDISSIKITVPNVVYDLTGGPFSPADNPIISAQFSIQYTVAAALVFGKLSLEELSLQAINDPRVRDIIKRIRVERSELIESNEFVPVEVQIKTTDGKLHSKNIEVLKGHPDNPIDDVELVEKFKNCASSGNPPMGEEDIDRLIERLMCLETINDIGEVTKFFGPFVTISDSRQ